MVISVEKRGFSGATGLGLEFFAIYFLAYHAAQVVRGASHATLPPLPRTVGQLALSREEICAFFAGVSGAIGFALHYMIAPKITVHDDLVSAEGSWYLWQPCTIDNVPVWLTGTYFDRYVKEDGVWKFSEVHLTPLTIAPFDEGWVKRPFVGE